MKISVFKDHKVSKPSTVEMTWTELADSLSKCRYTDCNPCATRDEILRTRKHQCDEKVGLAWAPVHFSGDVRDKDQVVEMSCLVFDIDDATTEQVEQISDMVDGYASILHSTHSHWPEKDKWCLRLVIQLSRPLERKEIRSVRASVIATLKLPADPQSVDEGRLYFFPSAPKGATFAFSVSEGKPLNPDLYLYKRGAPEQPVASVTADDSVNISTIVEKLRRTTSPHIRKVLAKEPLATVGGRDNAINKAVWALIGAAPELTPQACVHLMTPSLQKMEPPEKGTWIEVALEKAERASVQIIAERAAEEESIKYLKKVNMAAVYGATEEGEVLEELKYTDEQIATWSREVMRVHPMTFNKHLIINHSSAYWVFSDGKYDKPLQRESLVLSLERDLQRARVSLVDGEGKKKHFLDIMSEVTTVARTVKGSLSLKRSYYDTPTQTFYEALAPIELEPEYNEEVDEFINLLGNGNRLLKDWVAAAPQMNEYVALLFLHTPAGCGKTLLAEGLAKLWGPDKTATKWDDAFSGAFNSTVAECPLIFADERLPNDKKTLDQIRATIGNSSLSLSRKFFPTVPVEGRLRIIVAANNGMVFDAANSQLSASDIEAVADRIIHISFGDAHAQVLRNFFNDLVRKHNDPKWIEKLKASGAVARHSLWLAENHEIKRGRRFLVQGDDAEFLEDLLTRQPTTGRCLEFLARYISDTQAHPSERCLIQNGQLLVSTELLADRISWETYVPSVRVKSATEISKTLSQLASSTEIVDGRSYFSINTQLLLRWARRVQVGDYVLIAKKLGLPT